jgi:aminotransferase class III
MSRDKDILALNAFDSKAQTSASPELRAAVKRRMRSFGSNSVLFYREPIRMVRAEGVWMHDAEGRRYLDAYNNVPSVGHSHPAVVEAIRRQVGQLNTHTRYLNDVVDTYAERLLATLPASMSHLVLTCTGSEANDLCYGLHRPPPEAPASSLPRWPIMATRRRFPTSRLPRARAARRRPMSGWSPRRSRFVRRGAMPEHASPPT